MKRNHFNVKIGNKMLGPGKPCFVIAEAGSNHNGNLATAKKLVRVAAKKGADAIKFQLFTGKGLSNDKDTQEILEKFEFKRKWLSSLKKYADSLGIIFLATPFDEQALDDLESIGVCAYKISSGDLTYLSFIRKIAKKGKPVILSVGIGSDKEIQTALDVICSTGNRKVLLLHCIAAYPTKPVDVNLKRISYLRKKFGFPVGFSDHTLGIHIPLAAVSLGVVAIEKHFTLDRKTSGPDHFFAIEPDELCELALKSKDIQEALGAEQYDRLKAEKIGFALGRRSLFARKDISKGQIISNDDVKIVRPNIGIQPQELDKVVGKKARKKICESEPLTWQKLS
jgi:sialic acid synthase SpsE